MHALLGAAFLVDDSPAHLTPTSSQAHSFWESHNSDASSQQVRFLRAQKEASRIFEEKLNSTGSSKLNSQPSSSKVEGEEEKKIKKAKEALEKRKRREEAKKLKEEERKRKEGVEELELFGHHEDEEDGDQVLKEVGNDSIMEEKEDGSSDLPNAEKVRSKASSRRTTTNQTEEEEASSLGYSYLTPGTSSNSDWYQPSSSNQQGYKATAHLTLSSAAKAGIWNFPANRRDRALCAAFEALHAKGYYMGVGLRFGGDFVVYPGEYWKSKKTELERSLVEEDF